MFKSAFINGVFLSFEVCAFLLVSLSCHNYVLYNLLIIWTAVFFVGIFAIIEILQIIPSIHVWYSVFCNVSDMFVVLWIY